MLCFAIIFFNVDSSINIATRLFKVFVNIPEIITGGDCVSDFVFRPSFLFSVI